MKALFFIYLIFTFASCKSASKTEVKEPDSGSKLESKYKSECTFESDIRTVDIRDGKNEKGCETHYTKDGKDTVSAVAIWDVSYCLKVYNIIKTKLEDAGYNCKEISGN